MEPTHKNTDCYFFYYSTCTKGDNCAFRHEASALGCEVVCQYWEQGNCLNEHCNFRHMGLKKNRKSIPCYWESQRGGCKKPHCPFLHARVRPPTNADATNPIKSAEVTTKPVTQEWSNRPDDGKYDGSGTESDQGRGSSEAGSPAVDPLIVNFDEESDSESAPSPEKPHTTRVPYCKTYEEIRLEEIQAESAAYYSYEPNDYLGHSGGGKEKRVTSVRAARRMISLYSRDKASKSVSTDILSPAEKTTSRDFTILTLDEIRRRRTAQSGEETSSIAQTCEIRRPPKRRKESVTKVVGEVIDNVKSEDFLKDAIKTLAELKASSETTTKTILSRKRNFEDAEMYETEDSTRRSDKMMKVPPVRLRRSPKRLLNINLEDDSRNFKRDNARTEEIEVRLCDSSTSDDVQTNESKVKSGSDVNSPINVSKEELKLEQFCDTNLRPVDDEYTNAVDPASEDILKDIDALLKENPTV